jgi:carboxylesterase
MVKIIEKTPDPLYLSGGDTAILLIHGFTASPSEMSYLGTYLNEQGVTVSAPLLPGHGTTPDDCNRYRWQHWANYLTIAFAELHDCCSHVFLGGLSNGALLALYLGAKLSRIDGIITYSPAISAANRKQILTPVVKYFRRTAPKKSLSSNNPEVDEVRWAYDDYPIKAAHEFVRLSRKVKSLLPKVSAPLQIIYSTADERIRSAGIDLLTKKAGSAEKEIVTLHESGHIITLDREKEVVADKSYQFIKKYAAGS